MFVIGSNCKGITRLKCISSHRLLILIKNFVTLPTICIIWRTAIGSLVGVSGLISIVYLLRLKVISRLPLRKTWNLIASCSGLSVAASLHGFQSMSATLIALTSRRSRSTPLSCGMNFSPYRKKMPLRVRWVNDGVLESGISQIPLFNHPSRGRIARPRSLYILDLVTYFTHPPNFIGFWRNCFVSGLRVSEQDDTL